MSFLICLTRKGKAQLCFWGKAENAMTVAAVTCKNAADKIAKEKGIDSQIAINYVMEAVTESIKFVN